MPCRSIDRSIILNYSVRSEIQLHQSNIIDPSLLPTYRLYVPLDSGLNLHIYIYTDRQIQKKKVIKTRSHFPAAAAAVAPAVFCTQHRANNVTQVRHIIDIWQSTGNQNICLVLFGQDRITSRHDVEDGGVVEGQKKGAFFVGPPPKS